MLSPPISLHQLATTTPTSAGVGSLTPTKRETEPMNTITYSDALNKMMIQLACPHLTLLAAEIEEGRTRRLICVEQTLATEPYEYEDSEDLRDAAYEVRSEVAKHLGYEVADEDDDECGKGIPAIECFLLLSALYGTDWARLAYADYLSHFINEPCREPYAVASAVIDRAAADYADATKKAA